MSAECGHVSWRGNACTRAPEHEGRHYATTSAVLEAKRLLLQDPEWHEKVREGIRRRSHNAEWRRNMTEARRKLARDPEWLRKMTEKNRSRARDPEWLRRHRAANPARSMTLRLNDEWRENHRRSHEVGSPMWIKQNRARAAEVREQLAEVQAEIRRLA